MSVGENLKDWKLNYLDHQQFFSFELYDLKQIKKKIKLIIRKRINSYPLILYSIKIFMYL